MNLTYTSRWDLKRSMALHYVSAETGDSFWTYSGTHLLIWPPQTSMVKMSHNTKSRICSMLFPFVISKLYSKLKWHFSALKYFPVASHRSSVTVTGTVGFFQIHLQKIKYVFYIPFYAYHNGSYIKKLA